MSHKTYNSRHPTEYAGPPHWGGPQTIPDIMALRRAFEHCKRDNMELRDHSSQLKQRLKSLLAERQNFCHKDLLQDLKQEMEQKSCELEETIKQLQEEKIQLQQKYKAMEMCKEHQEKALREMQHKLQELERNNKELQATCNEAHQWNKDMQEVEEAKEQKQQQTNSSVIKMGIHAEFDCVDPQPADSQSGGYDGCTLLGEVPQVFQQESPLMAALTTMETAHLYSQDGSDSQGQNLSYQWPVYDVPTPADATVPPAVTNPNLPYQWPVHDIPTAAYATLPVTFSYQNLSYQWAVYDIPTEADATVSPAVVTNPNLPYQWPVHDIPTAAYATLPATFSYQNLSYQCAVYDVPTEADTTIPTAAVPNPNQPYLWPAYHVPTAAAGVGLDSV